MRVTSWKGDKLVIRRRWLPWRRRRKLDGDADLIDVDIGDDPLSMILFAVFALPVLIVLALFFAELILLLLLLPVFVVARGTFGMPWTIEVKMPRRLVHSEDVKGWRASGERIRELAESYTQTPAGERHAASAATSTPPPSLPDLGV